MIEGHKIIIWDCANSPMADWSDQIVLWRSYSETGFPRAVSIPTLVEKNANVFRDRYLSLIYDLGNSRVGKTKLLDSLQLRPGFSYWWMTLIAEKCNYAKSPLINDAIRLFAFEEWVANAPKAKSIKLVSANQELCECLKNWCETRKIQFESRQLPITAEPKTKFRRVFNRLPHTIQAGASLLKYLINRWPLRGVGLKNWRETTGNITFFTYSDNLTPSALTKGKFESHYWAHLPDVLNCKGQATNWLHIYSKDSLLTSPKKASLTFNKFNEVAGRKQSHVSLDTFINLRLVFKVIVDFLRLFRTGVRVESHINSKKNPASEIWPLLRSDWHASLFGVSAISNLLFLNLFETAVKTLPIQQKGLYLQENMVWESALNHIWKEAGHGSLIGVPHSTVLFWDLRYFHDPRSYNPSSSNHLPLPNYVAINGSAALNAYLDGGYPREKLVQVEALRYIKIAEAQRPRVWTCKSSNKSIKLLVLGDYLASNTSTQLKLLEEAVHSISLLIDITFKPHPNCRIELTHYPGLTLKISMEPIEKLLAECDIAYVSASTSAAVDAYCMGVPIISLRDAEALNLSPLRGFEGVLFVDTPETLESALSYLQANPRVEYKLRQEFFNLDKKLPKWLKLFQ
ncbi:TIGR04326 family surface carbohydrate biosynthesis protein [Alphaproteobacteria bacterium LSUCC0744]